MFLLKLECAEDLRDLLIAELWEAGVAGITETPTGVQAFFDDSVDREALAARFPGARIQDAEERDWVAESREALQPMLVGRRFFLVPQWRSDPAPEGRFRIQVNSGLAFGTGAHESTRLCLQGLEEIVTPGVTAVDIGTGSGILAEAAKLLGAGRVIACDIDPLAIDVARDNFAVAGVSVELFEGSIQQLQDGIADVLIANLSPDWLALLAPEFTRVLKVNGTALLSGLEAHDLGRVEESLRRSRLCVMKMSEENSWRALYLKQE